MRVVRRAPYDVSHPAVHVRFSMVSARGLRSSSAVVHVEACINAVAPRGRMGCLPHPSAKARPERMGSLRTVPVNRSAGPL